LFVSSRSNGPLGLYIVESEEACGLLVPGSLKLCQGEAKICQGKLSFVKVSEAPSEAQQSSAKLPLRTAKLSKAQRSSAKLPLKLIPMLVKLIPRFVKLIPRLVKLSYFQGWSSLFQGWSSSAKLHHP
jgi:hypothetical protein